MADIDEAVRNEDVQGHLGSITNISQSDINIDADKLDEGEHKEKEKEIDSMANEQEIVGFNFE
eukprot:CAMPEP_0116928628 /NCGR_PEP_ID=MMETSP0467-20121206/26084_1 /TAXON_ID=283647 /ORGANISM="Mesodinium pulex, Strain SPMC105" /LENGTH=62 /DNA_ID=CAMNT_0004608413 /DNA_START=1257 /DNA_END=1445 /DNA_ORIENTATION=-